MRYTVRPYARPELNRCTNSTATIHTAYHATSSTREMYAVAMLITAEERVRTISKERNKHTKKYPVKDVIDVGV